MRRASIATVCALLALAAVAAATAAPPPGKGQGKGQERANTRDETSAVTAAFSSLNPGNNAGDLAETVNVNVVFVGYEGQIDDRPWSCLTLLRVKLDAEPFPPFHLP